MCAFERSEKGMDFFMEEKKNLEVVSGDGSNLSISQVYDHLNVAKPKSATEKPTDIVVPKETHKPSKDKENEDNTDDKEEKKEEEN